MKERPILFSGAMVRALLANTKTQTRRAVKIDITMGRESILAPRRGKRYAPVYLLPENAAEAFACCPYGQPGDRLWVRESFAEGIHQMTDANHWAYAADHFGTQQRLGDRWKPSIHMPRAASRITLEITSVRVERLQDISSCDAIAEGIEACPHGGEWRNYLDRAPYRDALTPRVSFRSLWDSINGPGSWDSNPWVWALSFRQIDKQGGAA